MHIPAFLMYPPVNINGQFVSVNKDVFLYAGTGAIIDELFPPIIDCDWSMRRKHLNYQKGNYTTLWLC